MKNSISELLKKLRNNCKLTEKELLEEYSNGYTIFEYALKYGYDVNSDKFRKTKSLDLILQYKKYELLKKVSIKALLKTNRYNTKESYLQTIIKQFMNKGDINISYINPFDNSTSLRDIAKVYIMYAKYDLISYLPLLDANILLSKEIDDYKEYVKSKIPFINNKRKTLLELMLIEDKELTIKKILNKPIRRNLEIALILRTYEISQNCIDYDLKPNNYIKAVVDSINEEIKDIKLSKEENSLLQLLYYFFIDGSDKEAVDALINSYKIQLRKKNPDTILEIKRLIELKQEGIPAYIKIGGSRYSLDSTAIEIKNGIVDTVNHEMGHALYHNLTDERVPEEFWDIIDGIKNNYKTMKKIYEYSKEARDDIKKIVDYADKRYEEDFPLMSKIIEMYEIKDRLQNEYNQDLDNRRIELEKETFETRKKISEFLLKSKEEKFRLYRKKGYSEEDLNVLLSNSFTIRQYALMHKRIQKSEYIDAISSSLLGPELSIGDIIDAIYQGEFLSGKLLYWDLKIKPVSGHGIFYYNYEERNIFDEVLANYRTIMMSENSEENLKKLRYYVGDELVDFLDDYYSNTLLRGNVKGENYGR